MTTSGLIVLAEDNEKLRKLYSDWLTHNVCPVFAVPDGIEVLNLLTRLTPRLLLLDIMMPNMGGIETCRRVRERVGFTRVPIVFLSSLDRLGVLQECMAAGGDGYIIKTDGLADMRDLVAYWFRRSGDHELVADRAKSLANITAKATEEAAAEAAPEAAPGDSQPNVREISEFVSRARSYVRANFGQTVEEKLYLLGYVTGVVERWSNLLAPGGEEHFMDCLEAVLLDTRMFSDREILDMRAAFAELAADPQFAAAREHGRKDPAQRRRLGRDYVPVGLSNLVSSLEF